jgi:tetratricopeptide (TPR) repeat protein
MSVSALLAFAGCLACAGVLAPGASAQGGGDQIFSQEEICKKTYQTGLEYLKNRRLDSAGKAFAEVKEACPEMIDAYLNLGLVQVQLGQHMEAIDTYEDALDEQPDNIDVKEGMAYALSSAGELDDAIALYLELHELQPDDLEIVRNLAFVYKQKGLVAEAVMLYNRLIELGVAKPTEVAEAGGLALQEKLYLPAVTFYQNLYQHDPDDVSTLSILGGYYWKIKFFEEAIPYYEKILEIDPQNAQTLLYHKILLVCKKSIGDFAGAARHAEYVITQEPDDPANYCNLAFIYKDAKDYENALLTVQRGLQVAPEAGCLHYAWGVALEVQGTSLESVKRFDDAVAKFTDAKGKFERVISLGDPRFASYAGQQLGRMDQLIERTLKLQERAEMGG